VRVGDAPQILDLPEKVFGDKQPSLLYPFFGEVDKIKIKIEGQTQ
jgi:hypothetical protein